MAHRGPSLYGPGAGGAAVPAPDLGVNVGQLEMGNATALDATVQMIGAQRQFETAMQAIQTYRRLDDRVIEVGKAAEQIPQQPDNSTSKPKQDQTKTKELPCCVPFTQRPPEWRPSN